MEKYRNNNLYSPFLSLNRFAGGIEIMRTLKKELNNYKLESVKSADQKVMVKSMIFIIIFIAAVLKIHGMM